MEYRDIKYEYEEWITYNGSKANCYSCSDKNLLEGLGLKYISSNNLEDMHESIDFYINNRPTLLKTAEREKNAIHGFYATLNYKGD